jgi:hypothetical protein
LFWEKLLHQLQFNYSCEFRGSGTSSSRSRSPSTTVTGRCSSAELHHDCMPPPQLLHIPVISWVQLVDITFSTEVTMTRFWKILAIAALAVIVLAVGASAVLAQQAPNSSPQVGPNSADDDGDGVCDLCGATPGSNYGQSGMGGYGMRGGRGGWGMQDSSLVAVTAQVLDLTTQQVIVELSDGITIAQLALNHGADPQDIIDAFLAEREAALQEAVAQNLITQQQADLMLDHMAEQVAEHINEPWTAGGYGPGVMGKGGCGGGGWNGGGAGGSMMRQRGSGYSS